jgi:MORN repeat variant
MRRSGWLVVIALTSACNSSPPIVALTERDCPDGATVIGTAPPAGFLQRCELPGGIWHGKTRAWYPSGRLRYETEWWQGVKHGKFTLWYPNGQKRAEGEDRYTVAHGKWTSWAEDGTVLDERVFEAPEREISDPANITVSSPAVPRHPGPGSPARVPTPATP